MVPNLHPSGTSWGMRTAASQVCADLPCFIQARCTDFSANAYAAYWALGTEPMEKNGLALLLPPLPLRWILRERSGSGKRSGNQFDSHPRCVPAFRRGLTTGGYGNSPARAQRRDQTANIRRCPAKTHVFARTCRQAGFGHQAVFFSTGRGAFSFGKTKENGGRNPPSPGGETSLVPLLGSASQGGALFFRYLGSIRSKRPEIRIPEV